MLLNFDKLVGEPKSILWQGKEYAVKDVTVELYLKTLNNSDDGNSMESMIAVAKELIPGFEPEKFPVRFLTQLIEFIISQGDEGKNVAQLAQ